MPPVDLRSTVPASASVRRRGCSFVLLVAIVSAGSASADVFRDLEGRVRLSLEKAERDLRLQSADIERVQTGVPPGQRERVERIQAGLRRQEEVLATARVEVQRLADRATEVQMQKQAFSAGFYASLVGNVIALAGLVLQTRAGRLQRELTRLSIQKTQHELAELQAASTGGSG